MDSNISAQDLRSGRSVWEKQTADLPVGRKPAASFRTDIIVIGAGITGSFIAEQLSRTGREVTVLDGHAPQRGSTAASTALLLWELDAPLIELESTLGFGRAAEVYRYSFATVQRLLALTAELAIPCDAVACPSVYLAGDRLDSAGLREEHDIRRKADLPGAYLDRARLLNRFGFDRPAALVSPAAGEVDPMALAAGLLAIASARGAQVYSPVRVVDHDASASGVTVKLDSGLEIAGRALVLATGYEMPTFVPAHRHRINSTWVMCTVPQSTPWPDHAVIWEASRIYTYLRSTPVGGIIVGGEDESLSDPQQREALSAAKTAALRRRLAELAPRANTNVAAAWSGLFGETNDSLPLIGPVPGWPGCFAAYGYGGNGLTFSAMAAEMLGQFVAGGRHWAQDMFALDR